MSLVSSVLNGQAVWIGLAIMIVSEAATLAKVEPFWSWNTPIAWTGFIIFADAIVFRARGHSWMRSAPREFALLALASIALWVLFEGYNRILRQLVITPACPKTPRCATSATRGRSPRSGRRSSKRRS